MNSNAEANDPYVGEALTAARREWQFTHLFTPPQWRPALATVVCLKRDLLELLDSVNEPTVFAVKLQWWQEEFARLIDAKPRHPLTQAMLACEMHRHADWLHELLDACEMRLRAPTAPDRKQWLLYLHRLHGIPLLLFTESTAPDNADLRQAATYFGQVIGVTEALAGMRFDLASQRCWIPESLISASGVDLADLHRNPFSPPLIEFIEMWSADINTWLMQGEMLLAQSGVKLPALAVRAALAHTLYNALRKRGPADREQMPETNTLIQLWTSWRTARRLRRTA